MILIPTSVIASRWYKALARIHTGSITFIAPNGERSVFTGATPGPAAEFAISDWKVIRHMIARGDVAMGEDFIQGLWTTPSIEPLFSFFLLNLDVLEGFSDGTPLNRGLLALHNRVIRRNDRKGSSRNIRAHYDVGNAFYSLWLDRTMTYSSALETKVGAPLEDAQLRKYHRILDRIGDERSSVLEIGSGWGGFAEQAATRNHQLTGLTISPSQFEFSRQRLGNSADIRLQDYRDVKGSFDAIVSIEMFEAVGEHYWPAYFAQLRDRMKRGGKAIIQTITIRDELFEGYRSRSDFIRHYVFPGGMLPSVKRFHEEAAKAGLRVNDHFTFGQDYAQTLRVWGERIDARERDILALGYDEKFVRNWRYYLGMCAAAFAVGRTDVAQIELMHANAA